MKNRLIYKLAPALFILVSIMFWLSQAQSKNDSFSEYRDFEKKPIVINKPDKINYYHNEEALIREKLKLKLSQKEYSILAGLHWILGLADNDEAFQFLFPDFMLLMNTLSKSDTRIHQQEVIDKIIKASFARVQKDFAKYFPKEEMARWRFLGLFPILLRHPEFQEKYFSFYTKNWADILSKDFASQEADYETALKEKKFKTIFDYLVWPSLLHNYLVKVSKPPIITPADKFPEYVNRFKSFDYPDYSIDQPGFRDLGYLATHVILALTAYGQEPMPEGEIKQKVQKYIESSFDKARILGDFDLFAEYIQSLKIINPKRDNKIKDLEQFLYDLQRPDGSWGSEKDFKTHPYTAIHPSGAALMALNQP